MKFLQFSLQNFFSIINFIQRVYLSTEGFFSVYLTIEYASIMLSEKRRFSRFSRGILIVKYEE